MDTLFQQILCQHLHDDVQQLALQRNRYPQLSDADFRFLLQQIDGWQRTKSKLPTLSQIPNWQYPVRLSCEQCSSEATAKYKALLISQLPINTFADLTGGYGIDTLYISEHIPTVHYVERNNELCAIAQHNFALQHPHIQVHNTTAESFLDSAFSSAAETTLIYMDPARRSSSGSKVFRLEDCEPNIVELLPTLRLKSRYQCFKLSPMIDITAASQVLGTGWDIHIIAVQNEVKEVLFINGKGNMHAVNLVANRCEKLDFTPELEKVAICTYAQGICNYLYEPNAAIIKSGAFKLVANKYQIQKLDINTHLYTSDKIISDFPGRIWQVIEPDIKNAKALHQHMASITPNKSPKYSVLTRNYPLTPEQLRKKLKLQDGDDFYLIGARLKNQPIRIIGKRVK